MAVRSASARAFGLLQGERDRHETERPAEPGSCASIDIRLVGETRAHHARRRKLSEPVLFCRDRDLSHLARAVQVYDFANVRNIDG